MDAARHWESKIFQQVCMSGQREATEYLALLDESLFVQCPVGMNILV